MHRIPDPGTISHTEGAPAANKRCMPEHTVKYNAEFCRCPAFTPGTPCTSASSMPTSTSDEQIPELVADKSLQQLHLPLKTSSDQEADREVEAICAPSEFYQVRSHLRRRRRYLMYNALDDIGEITQYKRPRNNSPSVQGPPVEH